MKHPSETEKPPGIIEDWIKLLLHVQFLVHAGAWPYRLLVTIPGCIGKRGYGLDCLAGLAFAYPIMVQKVSSRLDLMLCLRLWTALGWLASIHFVASHLLNRKWGIHSREIGSWTWLPRPTLVAIVVLSASFLCLRPVMGGLGSLFVFSPSATSPRPGSSSAGCSTRSSARETPRSPPAASRTVSEGEMADAKEVNEQKPNRAWAAAKAVWSKALLPAAMHIVPAGSAELAQALYQGHGFVPYGPTDKPLDLVRPADGGDKDQPTQDRPQEGLDSPSVTPTAQETEHG